MHLSVCVFVCICLFVCLLQAKKQHMSVTFRQELLSISQIKTDSRIGLEIAKLTKPNFDLVQLLGRSLPHIVPNVSLSKREVGVAIPGKGGVELSIVKEMKYCNSTFWLL